MQARTLTPLGSPVLTTLVKEHEPAIFRRALRLARDRSDACDLVQDTFERAFRTISGDYPPERVRGWLLLTLKNLYIDRRRASRRARLLPLFDDLPAPSQEPEEMSWRHIEDESLEQCLELLDARLREVYLMRVSQGLSLAAISAKLGIPIATAGTRIHRARMQLRHLLLRAPTPPAAAVPDASHGERPKTQASQVLGPTMPSATRP